MHLHLPRPLHGWREFAGEVGIIVIGVLIALGAEQLVETWSWQRKAEQAQRTINSEVALDAGVFDAERMVAPCLKKQLTQVGVLISNARQTGRIGDVKGITGGGSPQIVTTAWDGALADGTVSHIPEDRRRMYSILYSEIVEYEHQLGEESRLWTHLRLLQHSPGRISDSMLTDIAASAGELRYRVALEDIIAEQALVIVRGLGIEPSYGFLTGAPGTLGHGTRDDVLRQFQATDIADPNCAPVLTDGHYVSSGDPQK